MEGKGWRPAPPHPGGGPTAPAVRIRQHDRLLEVKGRVCGLGTTVRPIHRRRRGPSDRCSHTGRDTLGAGVAERRSGSYVEGKYLLRGGRLDIGRYTVQ
jgi:hypothetical protein